MRIHQFDDKMRPDSEFQPGDLKFLCAGNQCRLMDARRTPGIIESVSPEGVFRWRISAFEDKGEYWDVPIEHVTRFQFELDASELQRERVAELQAQIEALSRPLSIPIETQRRSETESRIAREEESLVDWLLKNTAPLRSAVSLEALLGERSREIADSLTRYMTSCGLSEQEELTSKTYVLNPSSGEWIKGLQIVFAELGLKEFNGTIPRTADIFAGSGDKQMRQKYIVHRLAFVRAVFKLLGFPEIVLFRGMAAEGDWRVGSQRFFSSWTFSREVAEAFVSSNERAKHWYLLKRTFPIEKVFMTCVETAAMNRQYRELEAVVIHDRDDERLW